MKYFINKTPESIATTGIFRKFEVTTNQITMTNLQNPEQETWKDIKGWPNYKISSKGTVINKLTGHKLKPCVNSSGYTNVVLSVNKIKKTFSFHRLLAQHFLDNPDNKTQINHINGIKTDNRLGNIEWCTGSENMFHAYRSRLQKPSDKQKIATAMYCKQNYSKPVIQKTINGVIVRRFASASEAALETGFCQTHISSVCRGKVKTCHKFIFEYESK